MDFEYGLRACCILIHILVKAKLIKDAKAIFESVLTKDFSEGFSQTLVVLNSLIDSYRIREIYRYMHHSSFQESAFVCNLFVGGIVRGRIDEAILWLKEMERMDFKPSGEAFNHLIKGCSSDGRLDDSLVFCKLMMSMGLLPSCSAVNEMFGKLCENGKTKEADEMLTILLDKGFAPNENTYSHLISGFGNDDDIKGLTKVFEMEYRSNSPNISGFTSVITSLCECGRLEEAEKYLERMKAQSFISPDIYERLIEDHSEKGSKTRACQLYSEMVELGSE
ncbi:hypothetical protein DH2020_025115 [Rehmannia glutinosa]|uniref:Pentatricopeptide repeat-containing protein n=1 Tax=Rehmannia glutinosa TaxID=99300 RepID=A0ABR0W1H4_REHGL